jgi:hypothetical protein
MNKIVKATLVRNRVVSVEFGDGAWGEFDLQPLIDRGTGLVDALKDEAYFTRFFLELGALCWPNGLEFSGEGIYRKLRDAGALRRRGRVA